MRAKSISCEKLMETGAKVAEFLKAERGIGLGEAEIAFFPDHGTAGGRMLLKAVHDVNVGRIAEVSTMIANEIIGPEIDVKPVVLIKDNHLIFGGELDPSMVIKR